MTDLHRRLDGIAGPMKNLDKIIEIVLLEWIVERNY